MAETLTFENTPETTTLDNLNSDEQDSLEVGEKMQEAQDNLLAGKYKDAKSLENAYLELQKKLGSNEEEEEEGEEYDDEEYDDEEYDDDDEGYEDELDDEPGDESEDSEEVEDSILDKLWEESNSNEEISKETLEELSKLDPEDLANMHLDFRAEITKELEANEPRDFADTDIQELQNVVGGEANYDNMIKWADATLSDEEIEMFDTVMERGDTLAAFFAVKSLAYRYQDAAGRDGKMVTGRAPRSSGNQFRSQAEVVEAMGDPRYDKDPAYRRDLENKLSRSNINF